MISRELTKACLQKLQLISAQFALASLLLNLSTVLLGNGPRAVITACELCGSHRMRCGKILQAVWPCQRLGLGPIHKQQLQTARHHPRCVERNWGLIIKHLHKTLLLLLLLLLPPLLPLHLGASLRLCQSCTLLALYVLKAAGYMAVELTCFRKSWSPDDKNAEYTNTSSAAQFICYEMCHEAALPGLAWRGTPTK